MFARLYGCDFWGDMDRNDIYENAIRDSEFGSISRLAEHLGLHYRNVQSYAIFERRPVDRKGIVKHDIAAICEALGCELEALFPEEFIDHPYRFRETYEDGYGQRGVKSPVPRYFRERELTRAEAKAVIDLLEFSKLVEADTAKDFALDIVRRLKPPEYDALRAWLSGDKPKLRAFNKAVRALNAPFNLRRLQEMKRG